MSTIKKNIHVYFTKIVYKQVMKLKSTGQMRRITTKYAFVHNKVFINLKQFPPRQTCN